MKQLLFVCAIALFASCNNAATTETKKDPAGDATAPAEKKAMPAMPFALDKPYQNWQPGDQQHALTVMSSLKAWENGDIAKSMESFADTVKIFFDGWQGTYSKDSLAKEFAKYRGSLASATIKMDDWESVISEDKKEEWVTLWYKQITTDKKGKTDSMNCINDAMIKNGKIAVLNEAIRHYQAKK